LSEHEEKTIQTTQIKENEAWMKATIIILTMQLVAVMKIFIAYLGLHEFEAYLSLVNSLMLIVYGIMLLASLIIFLKGQINETSK